MRYRHLTIGLAGALAIVLPLWIFWGKERAFGLAPITPVYSAKVTKIIDGDTFDVVSEAYGIERIRFQGIDASERGDKYRNISKRFLAGLISGKAVQIETFKKDRWNRSISKVYIDDVDIGLVMLYSGMAWHYTKYIQEQSPGDRKLYADAQRQAQDEKIGIWAELK